MSANRSRSAAEQGISLMVMRNGNDSARRWWDDLPPRIRTRVSAQPAPEAEGGTDESGTLITTGELARDLSRLALLFLAITVANMLFLLVALACIGT